MRPKIVPFHKSVWIVDITLASALACAEHTHATTFADLESQLFIGMANLSSNYLPGREPAAHTHRVAYATAERVSVVG